MPDPEHLVEYQCRNCGAYIRPEAAVWVAEFEAYYHRTHHRPALPCGPLRLL